MNELLEMAKEFDIATITDLISNPSLKTVQLVVIVYVGLLWLSIIIWVTRDAIHRSNSLLFQVFAILLNVLFPVLGILLYLIIRPGKTTMERYYEDLEHKLILESIEKEGLDEDDQGTMKMKKKPIRKKAKPKAKKKS